MAFSSFSVFSFLFLFLLTSPILFSPCVNSSLSDLTKACKQIPTSEMKEICLNYILGFSKSEFAKDDVNIDMKQFTEGFIDGATTAGHEMLARLNSMMKEKKSDVLQSCIYSYQAATDTTKAAYESFLKKDYVQASSKMLQASTCVWDCDKALNNTDMLESHRTFVEMIMLPITFIDTIQNTTKSSP